MKVAISLQVPASESRTLSESKVLRYSLFIVLYFAQGIFQGFIIGAVPIWMAVNGKSVGNVGSFIAVIMIPWTFKFLIGPLIDKFTILSMGRKRPWIILAQVGIFVSFLGFGILRNPLADLTGIFVMGFIISLFTAFQDVATDGLAIEVTPEIEQGKVNALMWGSKVISVSVWMAAGTWLINSYGLRQAVLFPAAAILIVGFAVLFVREHKGEKFLPWSEGKASAQSKAIQPDSLKTIFRTIWKTMSKRTNLWFISVLFLLNICLGIVDTLIKVFLIQQVHWKDSDVSNLVSTSIFISGIAGLFFAGFLIKRLGNSKLVLWGMLLFILVLLGMPLAQAYWNNIHLIQVFTLIYWIINTLATISLLAMAMTFCQKSIAASQFTLYMAICNFGTMVGAWMLGSMKKVMDWQMIFAYSGGLILLTIFTFYQMKKTLPKVEMQTA